MRRRVLGVVAALAALPGVAAVAPAVVAPAAGAGLPGRAGVVADGLVDFYPVSE